MKVLFFSQDDARVEQLVLALRLRWPSLEPLVVDHGNAGLDIIEREEPDLAVVCGDLVDRDIWSVIKRVRELSDIPIVVYSDDRSEMEVVRALESGADEHIRVPTDLLEVVARVVALMRRVGYARQENGGTPIRCGELLINPASHEAFLGSTALVLTPTEFRLLHLLAKNRHVTLPQAYIQRVIWSDVDGATEAVKKYVQRLRRKLGDDARNPVWIKTVHGVGYRFASAVASAA